MADDADCAAELIEARLAAALAARRRPRGESATECDECAEPIPPRRRQLLPGVRLCVDCAACAERAERGRR